jgi:hypothetical protein
MIARDDDDTAAYCASKGVCASEAQRDSLRTANTCRGDNSVCTSVTLPQKTKMPAYYL